MFWFLVFGRLVDANDRDLAVWSLRRASGRAVTSRPALRSLDSEYRGRSRTLLTTTTTTTRTNIRKKNDFARQLAILHPSRSFCLVAVYADTTKTHAAHTPKGTKPSYTARARFPLASRRLRRSTPPDNRDGLSIDQTGILSLSTIITSVTVKLDNIRKGASTDSKGRSPPPANLDGEPSREAGGHRADLIHAEAIALSVGHHVNGGALVHAAEALRRSGRGKLVGVFHQPKAFDERGRLRCRSQQEEKRTRNRESVFCSKRKETVRGSSFGLCFV